MNTKVLLKEIHHKPRRMVERVSDKNAVGYCHFKNHYGNISKKLLMEKKCLERQCPYLEKYELNSYWIRKEIVKAIKKMNKNDQGCILINEKKYFNTDIGRLLSICMEYIHSTGIKPKIAYLYHIEEEGSDNNDSKEIKA